MDAMRPNLINPSDPLVSGVSGSWNGSNPAETIHTSQLSPAVTPLTLTSRETKNDSPVRTGKRDTVGQIESDDFSRFEGEGGPEAPLPATELIDVPLETPFGGDRAGVDIKAEGTMKPPSACGRNQGMRVRRQVYELTLHDLSTFPVWEFRLDEEGEEGRDESTVRPYTTPGPLDPTDRMFVVRAVFTLADGSRRHGYLTPPVRNDGSIGALQPIIVTACGQVRFWCGTAVPDAKRLARNYAWLGKDVRRVFPVQFCSDVALIGGPVTGSVPGFLVLEDFQTRKTSTVR